MIESKEKSIQTFQEAFKDQVITNQEELLPYSRDWTNRWESKPSLVATPNTTDQLAQMLKFCNENEVSVVPSGGRTGLVGATVLLQD